jgi:hypothetical protein
VFLWHLTAALRFHVLVLLLLSNVYNNCSTFQRLPFDKSFASPARPALHGSRRNAD